MGEGFGSARMAHSGGLIMGGLIELVFVRVPDGAVHKLVNDLSQSGDILEFSHSEVCGLNQEKAILDLTLLLKYEVGPFSIFVRIANASIGGVPIRSSLVRILRFEGMNEVAFVFGSAEIEATDRQDAVEKLAAGAEALASGTGVLAYYCGFEPATDEKTRLFSNERMGPLVSI